MNLLLTIPCAPTLFCCFFDVSDVPLAPQAVARLARRDDGARVLGERPGVRDRAAAGADLDAAFATVAAQFVMPKVKSADAAASGGGARGV